MPMVSLADISAARERIKPIAKLTPLVDVSAAAGQPLWLKLESLQPGGAFKIRGAYNMVAQLSAEERRRGVVTFSSGNHGQAMALAARALGAPAVVVMPTTAPKIKTEGCRSFGAEVIFAGTTSADRRARAEAEAAARGFTSISVGRPAWKSWSSCRPCGRCWCQSAAADSSRVSPRRSSRRIRRWPSSASNPWGRRR